MAPIHAAARRADVAYFRRLLAAGVSPDAFDALDGGQVGLTPLQNLCEWTDRESDRVACFELLREAGANLEALSSPTANTALHYAASAGCFEIVSLLVEAGVNVNVINNDGFTPLHWAAYGGHGRHTGCIELLLEAGATVNVNAQGWTPLDYALMNGDRRVWPLFLRAGAAEFTSSNHTPYTRRVQDAGGFEKYAQNHLARITAILAPTPLLPPELVRKILEFWLHAGYYCYY